jgi:hypothetical protein
VLGVVPEARFCVDLGRIYREGQRFSRSGELEAQAGIGGAMLSLSSELVFLNLQFLDEEKFKETVHK